MPHPPRAILLTFDRLSRRCLSFYGHEWIEAPNLERLATRAVVFDQHFGTGIEGLREFDESVRFWNQLITAGVEAKTLFEQLEPVDSESSDLEMTSLTRLMTQADEALTEFAARPESPWLLRLKSVGIAWPCVATEEFAALYADELEGEQGELADEIKLAEVAYAASVTQLDHLVGRLLATIERLFGDEPPLLIVAALAGESLGELEPLPLAHVDTSPSEVTWKLRGEMVHTLLLVSEAASDSAGSRRQELVQVTDLLPTLLEWFHIEPEQSAAVIDTPLNALSLLPLLRNEATSYHEAVFLRDDEGHAAMRTRDFLLVEREVSQLLGSVRNITDERVDATGFSCQLFLKPEDVWEVNDVAEQNPEQVAAMREALRDWLQRVSSECESWNDSPT